MDLAARIAAQNKNAGQRQAIQAAGHASARPGVDIHGDSASDSSVVDDMLRRAAAVAGDSEGSGMDISRRAVAWSRDVPGG